MVLKSQNGERKGVQILPERVACSFNQTVDLNRLKTFYSTLPRGVDSFSVEIFDEKSFTTDERIAWAVLNIPERVIQGETVDDWYPLSGKQGDLAEGQGQVHHMSEFLVHFRSIFRERTKW